MEPRPLMRNAALQLCSIQSITYSSLFTTRVEKQLTRQINKQRQKKNLTKVQITSQQFSIKQTLKTVKYVVQVNVNNALRTTE